MRTLQRQLREPSYATTRVEPTVLRGRPLRWSRPDRALPSRRGLPGMVAASILAGDRSGNAPGRYFPAQFPGIRPGTSF